MISADRTRFKGLIDKVSQSGTTSKFFMLPAENRQANLTPSQTKVSNFFKVWLNNLGENENTLISKTIYDQHMSWQKNALDVIDYDKEILTHLFNETLLKCSSTERKALLVKSKQQISTKETFSQNIFNKLSAIGQIIASEQFLRDGLTIVAVCYLTGSVLYLLISQIAFPAIAIATAAISSHLPEVMAFGIMAYKWRFPIIIGRFIITRAVKNGTKLKRWLITPVNLFLNCTLFLKMQIMRKSYFLTYTTAKFASPNLQALESGTIEKIKNHPKVSLLITQVKKRKIQIVKATIRETLRTACVDYKLGRDLVKLRSEWITCYQVERCYLKE